MVPTLRADIMYLKTLIHFLFLSLRVYGLVLDTTSENVSSLAERFFKQLIVADISSSRTPNISIKINFIFINSRLPLTKLNPVYIVLR